MRTLNFLSRHFPRLIAPLTLLFLGCGLLASCSTLTTGVVPAVAIKYACDRYGAPITYDSTKDTRETTRQVQVKNKAFADCPHG